MEEEEEREEAHSMYTERQPSSRALLTCSRCGAVRYVGQEFLDLMTSLEAQQGPGLQIEAVLPRHKPCNAIMHVQRLPPEQTPRDTPSPAQAGPQQEEQAPGEGEGARIPTRERLARDLERAGAPPYMIAKARAGAYDDYLSDSPAPIHDLVHDARAHHLGAIAQAAIDGQYDAQPWESAEWASSDEGQAFFAALVQASDEGRQGK